MKKEIIPAPIKAITMQTNQYDFDENEHEIEYTTLPAGTYPKLNPQGFELFDANGNCPLSDTERKQMIDQLEQKFIEVMEILRISRNDPNCTNTPVRLARMYVGELFAGRYQPPPKLTIFPNRKQIDELIISKGIEVLSVCSHHWEPISGECAIGYIPDQYLIGLSKLNRIVDWYARRGQIQEELGQQIADYLEDLIKPKALGVVIKAKHYCMIARGVKGSEAKSMMVTSVMRGLLLDEMNLRNEFLKLIAD